MLRCTNIVFIINCSIIIKYICLCNKSLKKHKITGICEVGMLTNLTLQWCNFCCSSKTLLLMDDRGIHVSLVTTPSSQPFDIGSKFNDGNWIHGCFVWSSQGGIWDLYINGVKRAKGNGYGNQASITGRYDIRTSTFLNGTYSFYPCHLICTMIHEI